MSNPSTMTARLLVLAPLAAAILVTAASAAAAAAAITRPERSAATASSSSSSSSSSSLSAEAIKPGKCPDWLDGAPIPIEHSSDVCNFYRENNIEVYAQNGRELHKAMNSGRIFRMKDEETWICPEDEGVSTEDYAEGDHPSYDAGSVEGPKTKWIVRNRSSNPVSVALVDTGRNNLEVSAVHPKIKPAHKDPGAVLAPGQWKAITVALGNIFHVRELIRVGGDVSPGRVLIRYRSGPVAVKDTTIKPVVKKAAPSSSSSSSSSAKKAKADGNKKGGKDNAKKDASGRNLKKSDNDNDNAPSLPGNSTSPSAKAKARQVLQPILPDATPPLATRAEKEAQRGTFDLNRMCNSLNRLFVNRVGKPVDVYWAGASDRASASASTLVAERANECEARYAFHLGLDAKPHIGFFEEWDSYMSLENSYIGHHFVARLASNHSKVLHEIVLDRTDVGDCVRDREAEGIPVVKEGVRAGVLVGGKIGDDDAKNVIVHEIIVNGYDIASGNATSVGFGGVETAAV